VDVAKIRRLVYGASVHSMCTLCRYLSAKHSLTGSNLILPSSVCFAGVN
jgi:hypothetical protein